MKKTYSAGPISAYENKIACYGRDSLLFVEIETGKITNRITLPRIDKLFQPIKIDDEKILIGYTNWTVAGILLYHLPSGKVLWKHKRKFQGPQLSCRIYYQENKVFWVKNNTELICIDSESGNEIYQFQTTPWLYTDLKFIDNHIIYGTAGANGYINCVNAKNGENVWSVFLI